MTKNVYPSLSTSDLRKHKGRALMRIDQEQKMLNSGSLGSERLIMNVALDYMERYPSMSYQDAIFAAQAYCDRTHS